MKRIFSFFLPVLVASIIILATAYKRPSPKPAIISHVRLVAVNVADHDKAYDFYVKRLGFEVVRDDRMDDGYFWLMVKLPGNQTAIALAPPPPDGKIGGSTRIVLETEDIQSAYQRLKAQGVKFVLEPRQQEWGGALAQFSDPEGNIFALVEEKNP